MDFKDFRKQIAGSSNLTEKNRQVNFEGRTTRKCSDYELTKVDALATPLP